MKFNIRKLAIMAVLLIILGVTVMIVMNERDSKSREQWFDREFNQIPENPDPEDIIGLSLANLPAGEEKEIQEIIKKAFEGQWLYRYYYKNEDEMDELIEDFYTSEEYQQFKREIKERYKYIGRENSLRDISFSLEKMRFSKLRKYKYLDDRIGIVAGPEFGSIHYFLFKKVNGQWKIEKEKWPSIKYYFDETSIIKELIERENNETPEARIAEYLEAIKQNDEVKALKIWQLSEEKNWKSNSNYSLLEKRRINLTKELIEKKISNFKITDIEWRSISIYNIRELGSVIEDYYSYNATGARVYVQLIDSNGNKSQYVFDVFERGVSPKKVEIDYSSLRHWVIRDIYPADQEPLFWMRENRTL